MRTLFKVPLKVHHGLLLVTNLAERSVGNVLVPLEEIARKEGISQGFLEEIARLLRSAGLIEGKRGAGGGYALTRKPEDITVADVVLAIEGPVALVECLGALGACRLERSCTNRNVWSKVQGQLMDTLRDMTVAEVCQQTAS